MARRQVTNAKGEVVGQIDDQPKQVIAYDAKGKRIGRFDKKTNTTFDAGGREIGKGDQVRRGLFKL